MANTTYLDLVKPLGTDHALVAQINSNSDKIDAEAGRVRSNFAAPYSASSAYAVGELCTKDGNLYECNTPIGSGGEAWTAGHWTQKSMGQVTDALSQAIAKLNNFGNNYEVGSLSALNTQMTAFLAMMAEGENRLFRIKATASFGCFLSNAAYFVEMKKSSATYSSAFIQCVGGASAIIATKDTNGWSYQELTGSAISAANYQSSVNTGVIKTGNICQIACVTGSWYCGASEPIRQGSASAGKWIIPEGFRPIVQTEIKEALNGKRITINTDGSVNCNEALSGVALRFGGCYIANV